MRKALRNSAVPATSGGSPDAVQAPFRASTPPPSVQASSSSAAKPVSSIPTRVLTAV